MKLFITWRKALFSWVFASHVLSELQCVPACVSRLILETPGYGIDLSLDYLTSAVKYANGNIQSLRKLEASDEYREVMQKCLRVPDNGARQYVFGSQYSNPWMDHVNESVVDALSREIRRLIPFIDDVENIAVSIPTSYTNFLAHHVRQTMARLKLPLLEPYNLGPKDFMAISAYESGLCFFGTATPPDHCGPNLNGQKNERYPLKFILLVEYDRTVLSVSSVLAFQGEVLFPVNYAAFGPPRDTGNMNRMHWEIVTNWISTRVSAHRGMPDRPKFNQLVLVGERAKDAKFENAVWEGLRMEADVVDLEKLESNIGSAMDPEFVAAMGAAQVAKDWRDAPKPIGCEEKEECKVIRNEAFDGLILEHQGKGIAKDEL